MVNARSVSVTAFPRSATTIKSLAAVSSSACEGFNYPDRVHAAQRYSWISPPRKTTPDA